MKHNQMSFVSAEGNAVLHRMRLALHAGFKPQAGMSAQLMQDQQVASVDAAIDRWLRLQLAMPDEDLGLHLMPIMAERFAVYLASLGPEGVHHESK